MSRSVTLLGSESGLAMVALLMILSSLTILSVGFMLFSATELRIADNQRDHVGALYTAEAGVSEIVARMEMNPGTFVDVNGSTIDAYIGDNPFNPDPDWRTEVYLTTPDELPAPVGLETIVPTVQPAAGWLSYGDTDRGFEPIVVEHKWIDRNQDSVRDAGEVVLYDASRFPPENFVSGMPVELIRVPAHLNGSQRTVRAEVTTFPVLAKTTAAITSDRNVDLTGNMHACGHNHDLWTPAGTLIPGCRTQELCANRSLDATEGCLVAVMTTGDVIATGGSGDLEGFPTWSDSSSANTFYDIEQYLGRSTTQWNQFRSDPDYTSANDDAVMNGIVVINGDATDSERFNGTVGTGLIYVNGDMEIAGNFVWRGLIFVEGDCKVTGTAWILGGICVRGRTVDAFAAGNSTVLYSRDAIQMFVGNGFGFQTLAWSEI
jgi:hypothetical protein